LVLSAFIVAMLNTPRQAGIECEKLQDYVPMDVAENNHQAFSGEENSSTAREHHQKTKTSRERNYTRNREKPFILPVQGRLTSKFGYRKDPMGGGKSFHPGIDIAAPLETPVRAARDGKVVFAGWLKRGGGTIFIRHSYGFETRYLHLSKIEVRRGERVRQGQIIGKVGSTGHSTGPHLHFEIRKRGTPLDPLKFLKYLDTPETHTARLR